MICSLRSSLVFYSETPRAEVLSRSSIVSEQGCCGPGGCGWSPPTPLTGPEQRSEPGPGDLGPAMDEQATPGVFFNSSSPGGGTRAPQAAAEAAGARYNLPGILRFLRREWVRFEADRAQWEAERAELQVRAAAPSWEPGYWWRG